MYRKTAKDIAFDKERQKLKSEIWNLNNTLCDKAQEIKHLNESIVEKDLEIEKLNNTIVELRNLMNLDEESLSDYIQHKNKEYNIIEGFTKLAETFRYI